jgi:hypothetical protein
MHTTVQEYVRSCDQCQRNKASNTKTPGLLQPHNIPSRNWEVITMDWIGPLPRTPRGHDSIVTFTCKLSKMIHIFPTTTTLTAPELARLFFTGIFKHHGLPRMIISDRDKLITSDFWRSLFNLTGTKLHMSTAYHPQTDGQSERTNRTVEDMLRPFVNERLDNWDDLLPAAEFAYNNTVHAGTGYTPFYMNYGQHPLTPACFLNPPETPPHNQSADDFASRMRATLTSATEHLRRAIDKQKTQADKSRRQVEFQVGDKVWLDGRNLPLKVPENSRKLQHRRYGPYTITAKVLPVSYKLDLPKSLSIHPVFHVSLLSPYRDPTASFPGREFNAPPQPQMLDGEHYWTVEAILGRRWMDAQHAFQYLVKWQGFDSSYNSWEWGPKLAEQDDVAAMIRAYNDTHHAPPGAPVNEADIACEVCHKKTARPPMLLCDNCDRGYHISCLSPPLSSVPRGVWRCHLCAPVRRSPRRSGK